MQCPFVPQSVLELSVSLQTPKSENFYKEVHDKLLSYECKEYLSNEFIFFFHNL